MSVALFRAALLVLLTAVSVAAQTTSSIHPPIPLLDRDGVSVRTSGGAISTMRTCGGCHDSEYIATHNYHVAAGPPDDSREALASWNSNAGWFGDWNPFFYRRLTAPGDKQLDLGTAAWLQQMGWRHVGGGPAVKGHGLHRLDDRAAHTDGLIEGIDPDLQVLDETTGQPRVWDWEASGVVEMNCFLCHTEDPDNEARCQELAAGRFRWANTATLARTGIVSKTPDGWQYQPEAFLDPTQVAAEQLGIRATRSEHCGQCHGQTYFREQPLELDLSLRAWSTATKGQVFSPQRISDSAVNVQNKGDLTRPWDVHAAAMLECANCHFSLNDPRSYIPTQRGRPGHLAYEPRRLTIGDFLQRPSHQFAKGHTSQGKVDRHLDGTLRGCRECHRVEDSHDWLPYQEVHFARLSCEACHIAEVHAPAIRQMDWTMLSPDGQPRIEWRGVEGDPQDPASLVTGFHPTLLPREELGGSRRLVPHNLVATWYWVDESAAQPVRLTDLRAAIMEAGGYREELLTAFDQDGNGQIDMEERILDQPEEIEAVRQRLLAVGVSQPTIRAELLPMELHHGVGPSATATRECETCHARNSRLTQPMVLSSYTAGGVVPEMASDSLATLTGPMCSDRTGQLVLQVDTRQADLYVLGRDQWSWLTLLGGALLTTVALAIAVHSGLRLRRHLSSPRQDSPSPPHTTNPGTV